MTGSRHLKPIVWLLVILAVDALGSASAFSVAENVNNPLDTFPNNPGADLIGSPGVTTLVIEAGVNNALGGLGNCQGFSCNDSYDSFRIEVPLGLQINLTELEVPNLDGTAEQLWIFPGPPGGAGVIREPVHLNTDWQVGQLFALTDSISINGTDPQHSAIVLGPGFYDVIAFNFAFIGSGVWEATFTAGVQVVPLPAGGWMLVSALGVLAGLARCTSSG